MVTTHTQQRLSLPDGLVNDRQTENKPQTSRRCAETIDQVFKTLEL